MGYGVRPLSRSRLRGFFSFSLNLPRACGRRLRLRSRRQQLLDFEHEHRERRFVARGAVAVGGRRDADPHSNVAKVFNKRSIPEARLPPLLPSIPSSKERARKEGQNLFEMLCGREGVLDILEMQQVLKPSYFWAIRAGLNV